MGAYVIGDDSDRDTDQLPLGADGRSMRERMLAGELYRPDEDLVRESAEGRALAEEFNLPGLSEEERQAALVKLLGSVGEGTEIRRTIHVETRGTRPTLELRHSSSNVDRLRAISRKSDGGTGAASGNLEP